VLQVYVDFSLSYAKHDADDDIKKCAEIVKERFLGVGGPLIGTENLKEIKPPDMTKITYFTTNTLLDSYTCPNGELRQDSVCGTCVTLPV